MENAREEVAAKKQIEQDKEELMKLCVHQDKDPVSSLSDVKEF